MERTVGSNEQFEAFLKNWIETHKFQSVSSEDFVNFFKKHFSEHYDKVDWDAWLHAPGYPPVDVVPWFDDSLATQSKALASAWVNQSNPDPDSSLFLQLSANQKALFLDVILAQSPSGLPLEKINQLRVQYKLDENFNSEIRLSWLLLCLQSKDESSFGNVVHFVTEQGRMKYVRYSHPPPPFFPSPSFIPCLFDY